MRREAVGAAQRSPARDEEVGDLDDVALGPAGDGHDLPDPPKQTFRQWWHETHGSDR